MQQDIVNTFVPHKLLVNAQEDTFVAHDQNMICVGHLRTGAGNLPHPLAATPEAEAAEERRSSEIQMQLVGIPYARNSHRQILKVAFHPLSNWCLCVLTTEGSFQLYNLLMDLDKPEREFLATPKTGSQRRCNAPASFCFGSKEGGGWQSFAVYILMKDGSIYYLCPVVPSHLDMDPRLFATFQTFVSHEPVSSRFNAEKEEFASLLTTAHPSSASLVALDPEQLGNLEPLLQGPLRIISNLSGSETDNYLDIISFDYFPFTFMTMTAKEQLDVYFSTCDIEPAFSGAQGAAKSHGAPVPALVLYNRISLKAGRAAESRAARADATPTFYFNSKNPFSIYVAINATLFQVSNEW
jgi:hypothetical protein